MALVEEKIDTRLPYRIGYPILPVLKVETRGAGDKVRSYFANFDDFKNSILPIFAEHNVPCGPMRFAYRVNPGMDATDQHLTLVIPSWYEHGCQDRWVAVVKAIRLSLVESGIDCAIELIDNLVYILGLFIAPILSTDRDLIEGWNKVRSTFHTMIESRDWVSVDVFRREFPSLGMRPTVIICARDANDDTWWNSTLPALQELLKANHLELDIVLLFHEGITLMTGSAPGVGTEPDLAVAQDFYRSKIYMGTSCATSDSNRTGTLGGRVKLEHGDAVLELGLTNFHVLRHAFEAEEHFSESFPPNPDRSYGTAVSPSNKDHAFTVRKLEARLTEARETYERLSQDLDLFQDDPYSERIRPNVERELHQRNRLEEEFGEARTFSRNIGTIYAGSGFRTRHNPQFSDLQEDNNWALDWGLVQIVRSKTIPRQLRNIPIKTDDKGCDIFDHIGKETEVSQYCTISTDKNYKVMKRGRTTGWTEGTVSAIASTLRISDKPIPQTPTHLQERFKDMFGNKPVFVHGVIGTARVPIFLEPGDSGSLVLLNQPSNVPGVAIVGLGFAGNDVTLASYMIPMDLVVQDIEEITGGKVIEPQYAGEVHVPNDQDKERKP
ncbi:hypothetical protein BU26DRAFT_438077 [Trematosphaeria pertusa]|uniref:Uncharacterized protein n=1 Tax=Trematosphaeria pertusa TaxID=390896 RepID=A0A6A6HZJ4_9PLEO|nr:uncharacterized protein BU26DRAFT_438077 [Trematosphaeria pertusa]KAF2243053.1 hypothetical protein BU26DRAFT_438077 [Trematosphaeria pertusa]